VVVAIRSVVAVEVVESCGWFSAKPTVVGGIVDVVLRDRLVVVDEDIADVDVVDVKVEVDGETTPSFPA